MTASESFENLWKTKEDQVLINQDSIDFEVFEVVNGELIDFEEFRQNMPKMPNYHLMKKKNFNTFIRGRSFYGLWQHSAGGDVVDGRPFFSIPKLIDEESVVKLRIKTKSDFVRTLGDPYFDYTECSFRGFFDIRHDGTRFSWVCLEYSSKRLFFGVSKRRDFNYNPVVKQGAHQETRGAHQETRGAHQETRGAHQETRASGDTQSTLPE